MREYVRDKRSPKPTSEAVSEVMSANKAKNTKPELLLRKLLWESGFRGYRINYKKIPGRPDIVFVSKKVAIFVNGCFWHRCPHCDYKLPKNNAEFWKKKFDANIERDKRKIEELKKINWKPYVIWECELKKEKKINKLLKYLSTQ
jgi:DNA mismatch endonuclease (patch repair protein)